MTDRNLQIEQLFEAALDIEPAERGAFLDRECAGDQLLRREVEILLAKLTKAKEIDLMAVAAIDCVKIVPTRYERESTQERLQSLVGQTLDGRFHIEEFLGHGGMGAVYIARHLQLNKRVAIKVMAAENLEDPASYNRFQQEAEVSARIRHPNVVPVTDFGQTPDGITYLVMEYVEGINLATLLEYESRLAPEHAVDLACQICAGVAAAHRAGIIHRDLKPDNVMIEVIDGNEVARVFDFGIAMFQDQKRRLTQIGSVIGTPQYMSPEQCRSNAVDHRTDIYALGVMLYEMLSGQLPFDGDNAPSIFIQQATEEPVPLHEICADVPAALAQVVMKALAKRPEQRHQSAIELANELKAARQIGDGRDSATRQATRGAEKAGPTISSDRFSASGPPACLNEYLNPETFITRADTKSELVKVLKDQSKRLVIIAAPIGWGKKTLLASALAETDLPAYITDLSTARDEKEAVKRLMAVLDITNEDAVEFDNDPNYVAIKLKESLPPQTLLVFLHVSLNKTQNLPLEVEHLISLLIGNGFRCVVELWDLANWRQNRYTNATEKFTQAKISALSKSEVRSWLSLHGIIEENLLNAFYLLEGHPWGTKAVIDRIEMDRELQIPVNEQLVRDAAIWWTQDQKVTSYLSRIEEEFGQSLSPFIIQWFALFWPYELPQYLITSPKDQSQLQFGVRIGLLTATGTGYRARGWFHLFSVDKLERMDLHEDKLSIDWSQHASLDTNTYLQLRHQMLEIAKTAKGKEAIKELAMATPSTIKEVGEQANKYVPPITPEALENFASEKIALSERIFVLEQACRLNLYTEASEHWAKLTEQQELLVAELEKNWFSLRTLTSAYSVLSRRGVVPLEHTWVLLEIVQKLKIFQSGHCFYAAMLALSITENLLSVGQLDKARGALALAAEKLAQLPEPSEDHHYASWLELNFRLYRASYLLSPDKASARHELDRLIGIIERGLAQSVKNGHWQRRYFKFLYEKVEIADKEGDMTINTDILSELFESPSSQFLEEFLVTKSDIFFANDQQRLSKLDSALVELTKAKARARDSLRREPRNRQEFFSLHCGLLLRQPQAIDEAIEVLKQTWNSTNDYTQPFAEEHLRMTGICLKLVNNLEESRQAKLISVLGKIKPKRVKKLCQLVDKNVKANFLLTLLKYRVANFKTRFSEITQDFSNKALPSDIVNQLQEQKSSLNDLFNRVLIENPIQAARILALKYDWSTYVWQRELAIRRSNTESVRDLFPAALETIVKEMQQHSPYDPLTWEYTANFHRYIWQIEKAYEAAKKGYALARYTRRRRELLWLQVQILIVWAFNPAILATKKTTPADESTVAKLRSATAELITLWPDFAELHIFGQGIDGDEIFWQKVCDEVENRLGNPEEFWQKVTDSAYIPVSKDPIESTLADLTDINVLSSLTTVLQWASQKETLSAPLRVRLAESAIICISAARNWQHGYSGKHGLNLDYKLATSIILALKEAGHEMVLGRALSPITSRTKGRPLPWKEAAKAKLQAVKQVAVGAFAEHMSELWNKLKPYLR